MDLAVVCQEPLLEVASVVPAGSHWEAQDSLEVQVDIVDQAMASEEQAVVPLPDVCTVSDLEVASQEASDITHP